MDMKTQGMEQWISKQEIAARCPACGEIQYWFNRTCSDCGAVKATVEHKDASAPAVTNHMVALIDAILPAVRTAEAKGRDNLVDRSIRENVLMVAERIRHSEPVMASLCWKGVEVKPAYYDLESGEVQWLT